MYLPTSRENKVAIIEKGRFHLAFLTRALLVGTARERRAGRSSESGFLFMEISVYRSYKYRIYPNRKQVRLLNKMLDIHRGIYNDALQHRIMVWRQYRVGISLYDQTYDLKAIRASEPDVAWCNQHSLRWTLRRLDKAYQAFFRRARDNSKKPGFPRFKGRGFFSSIEYTYNNGIRLKEDKLRIQNIGMIRLFYHRPIPTEAQIKTVVVRHDRLGKWFVVFKIKLPAPQPAARKETLVGIDMGLEVFCALSTGELIANPRWFRQSEKQLGVLQKRRARCKRGSKQYRILSRQINRLHQRTASSRHDFHNQLSTRLVHEFGTVVVERLNIKGLAKSHVSKSIGDAGWGQFLAMLEYKSPEHGTQLIKVDARNTSQLCSACGCIVKKSLSVREHNCPECGYVANRDVNAARVILDRGLNLLDRQAT